MANPLPLEKMLVQFERLSLDGELFLTLKNEDELDVHIQFSRTNPKKWSAWSPVSPEGSKQSCSWQHFTMVVFAFKVPEREVVRALSEALLVQTSYADSFISQVEVLLGKEAVDQSIQTIQNFMTGLEKAVGAHLGEPATPELRRGKLRIIKNTDS